MNKLPLMLDLNGRTAIVIGGGKVAERRTKSLLETGAEITIISPKLTNDLERLVERHQIIWKNRCVVCDDLQSCFLIIAATDDQKVNKWVKKAAPSQTLINIVDNPEFSNIHFPAYFHRGKLSISISTNGASPLLAKKLKKELSQSFDEQFVSYLEFLDKCRMYIKNSLLSMDQKKALLDSLLADKYLNTIEQNQLLKELKDIT